MNTTHTDLMSTARVCELLQSTPRRIEHAAQQASMQPSLRLNGVCYWCDDAIARIREQLNEKNNGGQRRQPTLPPWGQKVIRRHGEPLA